MTHASFRVRATKTLADDVLTDLDVATTITGTETGTRPRTASWTGSMVEVVVEEGNPHRGDRVGGVAEISFRSYYNVARVVLSEIRNWDRNNAYHTHRYIRFLDIPVTEKGHFAQTDAAGEQTIRGRFYGPNHAEVAFEFHKYGIRGAGGGMRSSESLPETEELRRTRSAVRALIHGDNESFNNPRNSLYTGIAPTTVQTPEGITHKLSWKCERLWSVNIGSLWYNMLNAAGETIFHTSASSYRRSYPAPPLWKNGIPLATYLFTLGPDRSA